MVPGARYMRKGDSVLYEMVDYNTDRPYATVLGEHANSMLALVRAYAAEMKTPVITMYGVPESSYLLIANSPAVQSAEEDVDNHDYVFSVESIAELSSDELRHKKKSLNKLKRAHPFMEARLLDHHLACNRKAMYALFKTWIKQSKSDDWRREYRALQRALKIDGFEIVCIGAYDKDRLVGFTVNEIEKSGYYQGHYGKANYDYRGLGLFLEHETAKYIRQHHGSKYMNLQQDMGIEGIRYYKSSLHPLKQLKKYTLVIDTGQL
jgi:hypothetical protein